MRKSLLFAALAIVMVACTKSTPVSYKLSGEINGVQNGTPIELFLGAIHGETKPFSSTTLADGKFEFTGEFESPRLCVLKIGDVYYRLMVENGELELKGTIENGDLTNVQYTGSQSDVVYREKMAFRHILDSLHSAYYKQYEPYLEKRNEAYKTGDAAAIDSLKNCEDAKGLNKAEDDFFHTVEREMMNAFRSNADNNWGPLLVLNNVNYFVDGDTTFVNLYNSYPESVKESFYGKILHKQLFPERLLNKTLPEMNGLDKDGNSVSLKALCAGKKYVIVDFWASWCNPCRKFIPTLKDIYAKYSPKGVGVVSISIDKSNDAWQKALVDEKLEWPNMIDSEGISAEAFFVRAVPTIFLIDANGVVVSDRFYEESDRADWLKKFDDEL